MFRFIHAADLHLDSPLRGLNALPGAVQEEIRTAARQALQNLVTLCIARQVAFLVIAGDVYDGDWEDYTTGLFFNRCMSRLREHHIRVFLIRGNHDAASQISRKLTLPDNVRELRADQPETVRIPELNVAIHGQSFAQRAVSDNLALRYPPAEAWMFNIGLLHTSLEGAEGHEPYAPCKVDDLVRRGYQYWALGHIHKRQVCHESPYIIFPGNIQGRHIREEGEKGCTLVTVDGLAVVSVEHCNLDVLRFYTCHVDLTNASSQSEFYARVHEAVGTLVAENPGMRLALRIICTGETSLHGALLESEETFLHEIYNAVQDATGDAVWIEKVKFQTRERLTAMQSGSGNAELHDALLQVIASARADDAFVNEFLEYVKGIQSRQLRDYVHATDALRIDSEDDAKRLFADAHSILLSLLQHGGGKH